ncbi:MAG: KEOPS complex subunit Pcc1 [Acidilobaceae archaeon]|nr:KEOPS complex subunit Pcc1 [Acidilobaceae archaeon]MCX8165594.1 KEOPS complex subunit Pcc1 [Acidilobaceae archaeon]MDW7974021.1 KEOPS complex subunit Pcc1 [Sulfolobales archaeon]
MRTSAIITLCLEKYASPLYESLLAELSQPSPKKAQLEVYLRDNCIELRLNAKDVSSLRAVTNSYLYLVYAMYSSLKSVQE